MLGILVIWFIIGSNYSSLNSLLIHMCPFWIIRVNSKGALGVSSQKTLNYSFIHRETHLGTFSCTCNKIFPSLSVSVSFTFFHSPHTSAISHSIFRIQWLHCIATIPEPLQSYFVSRPSLWHSWLGQKKNK